MGCNLACNKKRITNIEQGISNAEAIWQRKNFIIRNSLFDIRYSFQTHGKFIILELTTPEEPAKQLRMINNHSSDFREHCRRDAGAARP
jgi:hypothetical protein